VKKKVPSATQFMISFVENQRGRINEGSLREYIGRSCLSGPKEPVRGLSKRLRTPMAVFPAAGGFFLNLLF